METDLKTYYAQRAAEYEAIYQKPERQADLSAAADLLQAIFKNQTVLEIACGTGYWTERIAGTARSILATDLNESVIEIAKTKPYPHRNVRFEVADLYLLDSLPSTSAIFGGFIWSHIPLQELPVFIRQVNRLVPPDHTVVFMDNRYVPGSSTPIDRYDQHGNAYQLRHLQNGTAYSVLKNFPGKMDLEKILLPEVEALTVTELQFFWICQYRTRAME